MYRVTTVLAIACAALVIPVPAALAQNDTVQLSAAVGGAFGSSDASAALTVAGGVQLTPFAGIEAELAYVPGQAFRRNQDVVPLIFPPTSVSPSTTRGRTIAVLGAFVASAPVGRLRPYAQVGGGLANIRRQVRGSTSGPVVTIPGTPAPDPANATVLTDSENAPALSAGGGLELRVWRQFAVGADVRYLRVFKTARSYESSSLTRVGVRLGYWF